MTTGPEDPDPGADRDAEPSTSGTGDDPPAAPPEAPGGQALVGPRPPPATAPLWGEVGGSDDEGPDPGAAGPGADGGEPGPPGRRVLVTGAAGHLGRLVVAGLAANEAIERVVVVDTAARGGEPIPGVVRHVGEHGVGDLVALVRAHDVDAAIHVASVDPPERPAAGSDETADPVVATTQQTVDAAVAAGLDHLVVVGSTAAYGHHPTNRGRRLDEDQPLRGGPPFAADRRAAAVEHVLASARRRHPTLRQAVLRVAPVLGPGVSSPGTTLLGARVLPVLRDVPVTWAVAWDADVVAVVVAVVVDRHVGIWNVAGEGVVTTREVADVTGARVVPAGSRLVSGVARRLGGIPSDPANLPGALRNRPVPATDRLRRDFPNLVTHSTRQAVVHWATGRGPA